MTRRKFIANEKMSLRLKSTPLAFWAQDPSIRVGWLVLELLSTANFISASK
jgi:hypothetical protein